MDHAYPDQPSRTAKPVPTPVGGAFVSTLPVIPRRPTSYRLLIVLAAVWLAAVAWEVARHTVLAPVLSPGVTFTLPQILVGALVLGLIGTVLTLAFGRLIVGREAVLQTTADQLYVALTSLQETNLATLAALADAIDARDPYTRQHSEEAAALAERTARAMGLTEPEVQSVRLAAILHDVGKLGVPDRILCKTEALTPEERELIQRHPAIGANIIERIPFLREVAAVVRHHQERFDGEGYPDRLAAGMIPMGSRIVAVVDAYNAMTTDRPYRKAMREEQALDELRRYAGTQFDPDVVATFISVCALPAGHAGPAAVSPTGGPTAAV